MLPLSNDEIVKLEGAIHAALQESEGDSRGIENLLYIVRVLRCRDVDAPIRTLEGVRGTCIVLVVHPLPSFPAVFTNARWTAPRLLLVARNITPPVSLCFPRVGVIQRALHKTIPISGSANAPPAQLLSPSCPVVTHYNFWIPRPARLVVFPSPH